MTAAIRSMTWLNRVASEACLAAGVKAATDITGFGLLGHALEMANASGVRFRIRFDALPWLPGALRHAEKWAFAGGAFNNKSFYGGSVTLTRAGGVAGGAAARSADLGRIARLPCRATGFRN